MSIAKATLRDRVLEFLVIVGAGQTATGEDAKKVDDAIDQLHQELIGENLVSWETSAIPNDVVRPLVRYIAADIGPALGKTASQLAEILGMPPATAMEQAMLRIRRQTASIRTGEPITARYF